MKANCGAKGWCSPFALSSLLFAAFASLEANEISEGRKWLKPIDSMRVLRRG
jgi:hypothetical protein